MRSNQGPNPQPRHVTWLGIKPMTFCLVGCCQPTEPYWWRLSIKKKKIYRTNYVRHQTSICVYECFWSHDLVLSIYLFLPAQILHCPNVHSLWKPQYLVEQVATPCPSLIGCCLFVAFCFFILILESACEVSQTRKKFWDFDWDNLNLEKIDIFKLVLSFTFHEHGISLLYLCF